MPGETHITEEARAYVGRTGPVRYVAVSQRDIHRFAVAVGDMNPLYHDPAYAKTTPHGGVVAPLFFTCCLGPDGDALDRLEASGLSRGGALRMEVPVPGFPGAIAAGREMEYGVPIKAGDVIRVEEQVTEIFERTGRLGPMIYIKSETTYWNQLNELAVRERYTIIRHR